MLMRFNDVPADTEFCELDHLGEETRYRKTGHMGISGMVCNAVRLPDKPDGDETPCWVPFDKEVVVKD